MESKLAVVVRESGLEQTKAQVLLDNFTGYFDIAREWEEKAMDIVVVSADQKVEMKMARAGRLFLREKRIQIEKTRKELKEQSLREGKAIDGIANVLKALIVPIEEYLGKQEKFVEIKSAEVAELARVEIEEKVERARLAKEEADRKEQERIRVENEKLKREAIAKEKKLQAEREKAESKRKELEEKTKLEREEAEAKQRAIEEKAYKEKAIAEHKARIEREKQDEIIAEQKKKAESERIAKLKIEAQAGLDRELAKKAETERLANEKFQAEANELEIKRLESIHKTRLAAEKKEQEKIQATLDEQIECPFCHKEFVPKRKV